MDKIVCERYIPLVGGMRTIFENSQGEAYFHMWKEEPNQVFILPEAPEFYKRTLPNPVITPRRLQN